MPRSAQRKKDDRFNLRITEEQKVTIEQAAELRHTSASNFMLQTAYEEALRVIEDANQIRLTKEAWDQFCAALDRPAQVIPELQAFMSDAHRYRFERE